MPLAFLRGAKMRRAVIEVQFNWIFVLIVGAIILSFFVGIVLKQKDVSIKTIGVKLAYDLETITTGAEVSKETAQIIKVPDLGISFSSKGCLRQYTIGTGTKQYKEKVIFAPDRIEGTELLSWTLPWYMPYRNTNFLLFSSRYLRYILVNDETNEGIALVNKVKGILPEVVYSEVIKSSQMNSVINQKNYKVRFIFFGNAQPLQVPADLSSMDDIDVSAIHVSCSADLQSGTLQFYRKHGNNFESFGSQTFFLGSASLFGAIFADDPELYDCNMQEAFKRMSFVTRLLLNRTTMLYNDPTTSSCKNDYFAAIDKLKQIAAKAVVCSTDFPLTSCDVSEIRSYVYDPSTGLERLNGNLQLHSCSEMY
ncbi:MAG: hypothetical protein V1837_07135 [Candidatus Woesearchaeota archaeon]